MEQALSMWSRMVSESRRWPAILTPPAMAWWSPAGPFPMHAATPPYSWLLPKLISQQALSGRLIFSVPAVQISFGAILTPLGVFLLTYGFGSFFQLLPGADIAAILLIYGFPITLLGFALSYAQLKPVPCKTTKEALALRDSQATDIQKQVRQHISRL